ncbi:MAG: hypothetical protein QOD55_2311, partial [Solirubrobacteraceae bacterium]|nr:hypothetical protein [Solirubrobacteraceae bacterium]
LTAGEYRRRFRLPSVPGAREPDARHPGPLRS